MNSRQICPTTRECYTRVGFNIPRRATDNLHNWFHGDAHNRLKLFVEYRLGMGTLLVSGLQQEFKTSLEE